jgi:hypothetical protein
LWSELAAASAAEPAAPREVPLSNAFAGYASATLAPDAAFTLTARGRQWLVDDRLPLYLNPSWRLLDIPLLQRLLTGFAKRDARVDGNAGLSLRRLCDVLCRGDRALPDDVARHALWLLKYDAIELA